MFSPRTDEDAVEEIDESEFSDKWTDSNPVMLSQRRASLAPAELVELHRKQAAMARATSE